MSDFLIDLSQTTAASQIGGKAHQLRFLQAEAAPTPTTFVCPWSVFEAYQVEKTAVLERLRAELAAALKPGQAYAVRSSANVEDGVDFSFAGQFETVLDVVGLDDVVTAIEQVWQSARQAALRPYLAKAGMAMADLRMAVMVQEMVTPVISGVSFSKNPMTGLDEVIVEAVNGRGDQLVQEGVTPYRWVYKWGDWLSTPADTAISLELVADVVATTQKLAAAYGAPIDLEWVYDGSRVQWVQVRRISTLDQINIYSNRISREVLPGLIKPLVWSVNVPLVNSAWIDIFTELIGRNDIRPHQLSRAFHYRAYFNMGVIGEIFVLLGMPQETLELMMGIYEGGTERPSFRPGFKTMRHLPRIGRFALDKMRFARRVEAFLPAMRARYDEANAVELSALDEAALLQQVDHLFTLTAQTAYFNIVTPLLMQFYNARVNRRFKQLGIGFDEFDMTRDLDEQLRPYDPNRHLGGLHRAWQGLPAAVQAALRTDGVNALDRTGAASLQTLFTAFITQFGHLSDSGNDFSAVPWRENPDLVLQMVTSYTPPAKNGQKKTLADLPLSRWQRRRMQRAVAKAQQFQVYREAVGFLYTYGYGLFRNVFVALGQRLQQRGLLATVDDIFYLFLDEVKALVVGDDVDAATLVSRRRAEMAAAADAILPEIIYGDDQPPLETAADIAETLTGTPTSRGYFKGPIRVIQGSHEFDKMVDGAVLVIPFSDVGWTPLFTRAGAVIAESGGMLSHSSIVAREYHLPAVVSVTNACRLLHDDMVVSVDGYKGEIFVHE